MCRVIKSATTEPRKVITLQQLKLSRAKGTIAKSAMLVRSLTSARVAPHQPSRAAHLRVRMPPGPG